MLVQPAGGLVVVVASSAPRLERATAAVAVLAAVARPNVFTCRARGGA
jgi:hypothetical protein